MFRWYVVWRARGVAAYGDKRNNGGAGVNKVVQTNAMRGNIRRQAVGRVWWATVRR